MTHLVLGVTDARNGVVLDFARRVDLHRDGVGRAGRSFAHPHRQWILSDVNFRKRTAVSEILQQCHLSAHTHWFCFVRQLRVNNHTVVDMKG